MENVTANAGYLEERLAEFGELQSMSAGSFLPVIAVKLSGEQPFTVFDLSDRLREHGWIVPAYSLPPDAESEAVLRIVVKENFSRDMAELLAAGLAETMAKLRGDKPPRSAEDDDGRRVAQRPIC